MKPPLLILLMLPLTFVTAANAEDASPWASAEVRAEMSAEEAMLPVRSEMLTPGEVTPRELGMAGMEPFFLIGSDDRSLTWLQVHGEHLRELGAAGLAVEVEDSSALARIRAVAPGLTILPVSGDDIARRLQLEHYPVLITNSAIEQ